MSVIPLRLRLKSRSGVVHTSASVAVFRGVCASCSLRALCGPCRAPEADLFAQAPRLHYARLHLKRGDTLYRRGETPAALYALRRGFLKLKVPAEDGEARIAGFVIPGECAGLIDIEDDARVCDCVAVEESEVCAISPLPLQSGLNDHPALQSVCAKLLQRDSARALGIVLRLSVMEPEERVAFLLLELARRQQAQGRSATMLGVPATRKDLASYLGLTAATLNRAYAKLQRLGWIALGRGKIVLRDRASLERLLGLEACAR